MKISYLKQLKLPDKSGVYLFFGAGRRILYVGKATSLRSRVRSYFSSDLAETRGPLLVKMLAEARVVHIRTTESVLEALILEANLIKKHQPYYNTREKDDKSFNYVIITKEKLPKVMVVRGKNLPVFFTSIFGPYTKSPQLREAMKIIRRIFPFLDEKSKNYLEFYKQINLLPDLNDRKLYLQNIKNIKLFFQGKKKKILKNLQKEMKKYAKGHEFEKAGEIKRQIFALQHINDIALLKQDNVFPPLLVEEGVGGGDSKKNHLALKGSPPQKGGEGRVFRIEAYDIAHMGGKNMVGVMTVVENGEVEKSEYKKFSARDGSAFGGKTVLGNSKANDIAALKEILERRLAHREWPYPGLIVVDGGVAQVNIAVQVLARSNLNIPVVSVLKDEKHKPKDILGDKKSSLKYKREIMLANSEAHRFAIAYHKKMRGKNFINLAPTPLHSNGEGKARSEGNF